MQYLKSGVRVVILIVAVLVFGMPLAGYALQKPTPEMIEQYKQNGTLAGRIEDAKKIGNHKLSPRFIHKLYPNQVSAEGGGSQWSWHRHPHGEACRRAARSKFLSC